jgi:integrase
MARGIYKLSGADLKRSKPGLHGDGGGLWLQVTRGAAGHPSRSWLFRFTVAGRRREMGLGPVITVGLAEAREAALAARKLLHAGIDPIERRKAERAARAAVATKAMTFDECSAAYIAAHRHAWRSERHAQQWPATLSKYVSPVFGRLPVSEVDTALVIKALRPIWDQMPKTASRLRGRIEAILDWATVSQFRQGENPARWDGHLQHLLASPRKLVAVKHHPALPVQDVPAFMADLRKVNGTSARAIEFTILTAARRGEAIGARWEEIDIDDKVWTVPAGRMKSGKEHRVPLSPRAIAIIQGQRAIRQNDLVFPGRGDRQLWGGSIANLIKSLADGATLHGFRSSFRDWCGEMTSYSREVAEAALAHSVGDQVELAYRRGTALEKRRALMTAWGAFCTKPPPLGETVVQLALKRSIVD